ncbi:hypothetical protein V3C99_018568 [Haemonchus contortus]
MIGLEQSKSVQQPQLIVAMAHRDDRPNGSQLSPQKIDINEAPMTKLSRQSGETHITELAKNTSPRVNGNAKLSSPSITDVRKQPALDSSSGTSDGSLNATYGTKNLEESVSILYPKSINTVARPTILTHPLGAPLINYPRFHFPQGIPVPIVENDAALRRVCHLFRELPSEQCSLADMSRICEAVNLPLYWKHPIFMSLTKGESRRATLIDFTAWWRAMTSVAHDEAARFIYTLSYGSRSFLTREDLYGMVMDIMHSHPGLEFCREAVDFHDKYCDVL